MKCISEAVDAKEVEALRVGFQANGKIMGMMKDMRVLGGKEKPLLGEVVNAAKDKVEAAIQEAAADGGARNQE